MSIRSTIGVLALQGAFEEHCNILKSISNYNIIQVRSIEELRSCCGLIIPGGESTTMSLVASRSGLLGALREFCSNPNTAVWGTCAGMILLAKEASQTKKGGQELFGGMDMIVNRNQYGCQLESFQEDIPFNCINGGPVNELASLPSNPVDHSVAPQGHVVALRQANKMCTTFHPELTRDYRLHVYFVEEIVNKI
ncbi:hypothetical protein E3P89_00244 [Wallemia ichthyophaga]|uniref:glutaminase n=1 Tax=Wallemia ichthyophaga TaxID=245174 RepID=A0A4T0HPY7_WALIC|nr:hypothetical protein E3P95_02584 [Wallemia ichthyophaga]TIB16708.1 hypothetical protein E3P90_00403 [Wallemia ichthyophaga]TIB18296.1 hypothetical protein E3P93_00260 [Wallemia ichthyophaga]TIB22334.1 hypothetical protein E3P88_03040 [Wallemia ichthyophaga]TIB25983.1 hypothetical protein E3P89_00244 [Wallemia ichthyophaga]